jgi:hypothetical protein
MAQQHNPRVRSEKRVKKHLIVFSTVLLSGAIGLAQVNQTLNRGASNACPVEIQSVYPQAVVYGQPGRYLQIRYRNVSGKDIRAIKFGALFFNALDEPTDSFTRYIDSEELKWDEKKVNQGKFPERSSQWSQYFATVEKADAYVAKVKFSDGTFWQDDGSYRCNAGVPELNIAKGGGLKAHEAAIKELERKTMKGAE